MEMNQKKSRKGKYSEYCTCVYDDEEKRIYFWDEMQGEIMDEQSVNSKEEAEAVMRIWQDNAPDGVIAEILN